MSMKKRFVVLVLQILVVAPGLLVGMTQAAGVVGEVQSLEDIQTAVQEFVLSEQVPGNDATISIKPLDSRLRLSACSVPLLTRWSPGSRSLGRVTVQVACSAPKPWRVHVQATATVEGLVWVLDRGVRRGDVLSRNMLKQQAITIGSNNSSLRSSGYPIVDLENWLGFAFARRVGGGMVLDERMLIPADLVKKGEAVLIVHESAGLQLQTKGTALGAAAQGERVQVRNTSSGKVLDATVVARGLVTILQ